MHCPRCQATLEEHLLDQVRVHDCPRCGGTWFTERALREAKDDVVPDLDWMDVELWRHERAFRIGGQRLACPSCGARMGSLVYGDTSVEIDHCPHCRGVWLDRDEFGRVLAALRGEAARLTASELLHAALREAEELLEGEGRRPVHWQHLRHVLRLMGLRVMVENPGVSKAVLASLRSTPFT